MRSTDQTQWVGLFSQEDRQKSAPKKIPETEAIFARVTAMNQAADVADDVLRLSMDAKATVKIGPFAVAGRVRGRGGGRS